LSYFLRYRTIYYNVKNELFILLFCYGKTIKQTKRMEETFNIYKIAENQAKGHYFIIDTQVHSDEMNVETKVTFYPTFSTLLKKFLYKLSEIYDYHDRVVAHATCEQKDGIISFKTTYDGENCFVYLKLSQLNENELLCIVNHINLFTVARQVYVHKLRKLNESINVDYADDPILPRDETAKMLFDRLINFYMIVPFLEAGKMPLSDTQKVEFKSELNSAIIAFNEGLPESWPINCVKYYLFSELSFQQKIQSLIEKQPECLIGSSEWITHHKKFIKTNIPINIYIINAYSSCLS